MKHLSGIWIFQIYLKVDKNMDLESQDPIFNANLGQDENLIWTKNSDVATPLINENIH